MLYVKFIRQQNNCKITPIKSLYLCKSKLLIINYYISIKHCSLSNIIYIGVLEIQFQTAIIATADSRNY